MKNSFIRGVIAVISYYLLATLISWMVNMIFEWKYMHAPGPVHLSIAFFLSGGIIWAIFSGFFGFLGKNNTFHKSVFGVHLIIFSTITLLIIIDRPKTDDPVNEDDSLPKSVEYRGDQDSKLVIDNNSDTLYYDHQDSVLIDKLSSGSEN